MTSLPCFFFNDPAPTEIYTLPLHDALPICAPARSNGGAEPTGPWRLELATDPVLLFRFSALTYKGHRIHYDHPYATQVEGDRKSTRLNSSHAKISYAVFFLKKKKPLTSVLN